MIHDLKLKYMETQLLRFWYMCTRLGTFCNVSRYLLLVSINTKECLVFPDGGRNFIILDGREPPLSPSIVAAMWTTFIILHCCSYVNHLYHPPLMQLCEPPLSPSIVAAMWTTFITLHCCSYVNHHYHPPLLQLCEPSLSPFIVAAMLTIIITLHCCSYVNYHYHSPLF